MAIVKADEKMGALLSQMKEVAVVENANGELLGYFTPRAQAESEIRRQAEQLFDFEEIRRRKREEHGKGKTTEEVLRYLQTLDK